MAAVPFVRRVAARRQPRIDPRPLGNKLQEIAARSPLDIWAIDTIADMVLARLDETDMQKQKA